MFSSNTRTINNAADYEISFFTIAEKIRTRFDCMDLFTLIIII